MLFAPRVRVNENVILRSLSEPVADGIVWGLRFGFGHVNLFAVSQPVHGLPWSKVAVVGVKASAGRDGILYVDRAVPHLQRLFVWNHFAHEGGHVEVVEPAVLGDPKPSADAVSVGAFRQHWHGHVLLALPLGAVVHDGENDEIFRFDVSHVRLVSNGHGTAASVVPIIRMDVVIAVAPSVSAE